MSMSKPFAITLDPGSSLANKTGSWRTERPVYVDRLPPCNATCPAGEDIQGWLFHAESGDYEAAWRHLTRDNPFPAIMGRVCYHSCEGACNRGQLDAAVGINSVERFLGDAAIAHGWRFAPPAQESGKNVLVVGAGPSGMSAAYHLRLRGHRVTVREAGPLLGGMMRFGIPQYRLPRDVLEAEMQRIVAMGVTVELNTRVARIDDAMQGFDAAFLAVGAHIGRRAFIPAKDSSRILDAVSVLRSMEAGDKPMLGRRVVVYGGGNTAIDVARTAKRLGATEAVIVYRRTRERMPAHDFEVEEALQEGVLVKWLSTIKQAGNDASAGALTIEKMVLDAKGNPQPTGEFETLEADSLVLALGQDVDLSLLEGVAGLTVSDGVVEVESLDHDDRPRRSLRRRRHGAGRAQRDGRRRPWQEGRALHRRLAARRGAHRTGQACTGELRAPEPLVLQRCAQDRAPATRTGTPHQQLRRGAGRPDRSQRVVRSPPLPELRQLLRMRQLLRRVPRQRSHQARPRPAFRLQFRLLQGLRRLRRRMPLRRHRDGARRGLIRVGDQLHDISARFAASLQRARARAGGSASAWRSVLRTDCPAVLGLVARRTTRCAHCVRYAQTGCDKSEDDAR